MEDFPLFPEQGSTLAPQVDALFLAAVAISIFFSALIAGLIIYFAVRYHRQSPDEVGQPETTSMALEVAWTVIPLGIALALFVWGTIVFFVAARPPADAWQYYVVGKQWMWKFQHPEGNREINQLHVPVGQPIKLIMTSEDVIHSFFVPAFRVKADVLPGRYTTLWFEATKTGRFDLYCAEYCGAEHSQMIGEIVVMEAHDYERWLAGERLGTPMALSGKALFQRHSCHTCHRPDQAARAPLLEGIAGKEIMLASGGAVVADDNYLRESILHPAARVVAGYSAIMPAYQGLISEEELHELILYIKSMGDDGDGAASLREPAP